MVWVGSRSFGVGKARSKSGKVIVVAHYHPKGNIPGQFHTNVLPPTDIQDDSSSGTDSSSSS